LRIWIHVLDWQRAVRLVGETMREIGILVAVFVPVDYALAGRTIGSGVLIALILASLMIGCGILVESLKWKP
jgi:hypothetical protein